MCQWAMGPWLCARLEVLCPLLTEMGGPAEVGMRYRWAESTPPFKASIWKKSISRGWNWDMVAELEKVTVGSAILAGQRQLNALDSFCSLTGLPVNLERTLLLACGRGKKMLQSLYYGISKATCWTIEASLFEMGACWPPGIHGPTRESMKTSEVLWFLWRTMPLLPDMSH
ncbi:hypothetical protein SELMODRAFT_423866 [Selaginella moellendorffii]|uniref:Uncharacterized protein n=1 Tax=Selaginella moellendorffii TaxID=88036 RepID=D8SN22_SELML|nr:hypothetical protein SELMODRAFT_423866 [Selaginella moellendorffii]